MIKLLLLLFLKPFVWCMILAFTGFLVKNRVFKKCLFISYIIVFIVFSNNFLASKALKSYEGIVTKADSAKYEVGVVLGGYARYNTNTRRIEFTAASDRLWQALLLYKRGNIKKIVLSGGNIDTVANPIKEADIVAKYLYELGIPTKDILIENLSRSTKENALFTNKVLLNNGVRGNVLIITSAWHIPRSRKLFSKYAKSYQFKYFGTDWRFSQNNNIPSNFIPSVQALDTWEILLKEIVANIIS